MFASEYNEAIQLSLFSAVLQDNVRGMEQRGVALVCVCMCVCV